MSVAYHHGIETVEDLSGPRPVRTVKSAVIGIVGTAPAGAFNEPVRLYSEQDAAQFGPDLPGFTIPQALKRWAEGGAGTVIVINVLDPETHVDAVADEDVTFHAVTGRAKLAHGAISDLVLTDGVAVTYVLNTDYEILDALKGEIRALPGGAIALGSTKVADYNHLDPSQVLAADIIGEIDIDGNRSGIEAFRLCQTLFKFKPKILIAPGYSSQNSVRAALDTMAQKLRGVALADAPAGTTVTQAIAGRGAAGAINFNTNSGRTVLLHPHIKAFDPSTGGERLEPYSQHFASVICRTDLARGFWKSPSNEPIPSALGLEFPITGSPNEVDSEANALNEVGITTIMNEDGILTWGNRTAAWPSETHPINFLSVRRTADMIEESIELAQRPFVDEPGSPAMITTVQETVAAYLRLLVQRGAILDGRVWWDPAENPPEQLALGNYTWCYDFMPPTPMERITNKARINMGYLAQLSEQMASV